MMKKTLFAVIVVLMLELTFTACNQEISDYTEDEANPSSKEFQLYEKGIDLHNDGKYKEAVSVFEEVIALNPERAEYYISLADAYVDTKRGNYAVNILEQSKKVVTNKKAIENKIILLKNRGYGQSDIIDLVSEEKFGADDKLISTAEYFYDDMGNIIKKLTENADGIVTERIIYDYDEKNLMTRETIYGENKSYQGHTEYYYNDNDRLDNRVTVNSTGRFEFHYTYYENNRLKAKCFGHELGEGRYEYTYDKKGNLIHEDWYDKMQGGNIVGRYDYTYNEHNILIREDEYNPDGSLYSYTTYDEYDNGLAKNMAHHYPDGTLHTNCDVNSYEYDNAGRLIKLGIYDKDYNSRGYVIYTYGSISK